MPLSVLMVAIAVARRVFGDVLVMLTMAAGSYAVDPANAEALGVGVCLVSGWSQSME